MFRNINAHCTGTRPPTGQRKSWFSSLYEGKGDCPNFTLSRNEAWAEGDLQGTMGRTHSHGSTQDVDWLIQRATGHIVGGPTNAHGTCWPGTS